MNSMPAIRTLTNGSCLPLDQVPRVSLSQFRTFVLQSVEGGGRIASFFGMPAENGRVDLLAVLAFDAQGQLVLLATEASGTFPSLTPDCPQAHLFEREIFEQTGLQPLGHPWLKPVRFASTLPTAEKTLPGVTDFYQVLGEQIHEVAVGPVHAGIIEPGHFRFQCEGETVLHLEIALGYQHRGVEAALSGGPTGRTRHYIETLCGDSTAAHMLAYCQALEGLCGVRVPPRAQAIRAVALELERMANHTGDLGALAGDVAFLPTASYCGRLRGDFLNMTAALCGSRMGRGLVIPGGVAFDLDSGRTEQLQRSLDATMSDLTGAVNLLWASASSRDRFEGTGALPVETARALGLVGPAARACGLARDVRVDFPAGMYRFTQVPACTWQSGDVFARAYVRWLEIQKSAEFVRNELRTLQEGETLSGPESPRASAVAVSLVEGWRGEVCHTVLTDTAGKISHYKIVDPSFHNWMGLAVAMRGQPVSDFPVCNKSFNLSYCGHDL